MERPVEYQLFASLLRSYENIGKSFNYLNKARSGFSTVGQQWFDAIREAQV
jgi:hypothetical protein